MFVVIAEKEDYSTNDMGFPLRLCSSVTVVSYSSFFLLWFLCLCTWRL